MTLAHVIPGRWPYIREHPRTDGRVLVDNSVLPPGTVLVILGTDGVYTRVLSPHHLGYVWSAFIEEVEP